MYRREGVLPIVQYKSFDADDVITSKRTAVGHSYIIDSYNSQIATTYRSLDVTDQSEQGQFVVELQLQF